MPLETAKKAVDRALSTRPPQLSLSFFGGEPLLHFDLVRDIVEYAELRTAKMGTRLPELAFVMNTNATVMESDALDLMEPPRNFFAYVSLDGDRETHDRNRVDARGFGSHDRVVSGIAKLSSRQIPYTLVSVIGIDSARELGRTVRALFEFRPARMSFEINRADAWTAEAIGELRAGLMDVAAFWIERFRAGEIIHMDPFVSMILAHVHGGRYCSARCVVGQTEWAVAPSGNFYACGPMVGEDTRSDLVIGHVDRGFDSARIRGIQADKDRVETTCATCELRDRCRSQCGCMHLAHTGRIGEINAVMCESEAAFIEASDHVADTLYAERCPAFLNFFYERKWKPLAGTTLSPLRRSRDA